MNVQQRIEEKLNRELPNQYLKTSNESHLHRSSADGQSHFKVVIVSELFDKKLPVKRHQLVYGILAEELRQQVHALALHTYTPQEWEAAGHTAPASPNCTGGSNH